MTQSCGEIKIGFEIPDTVAGGPKVFLSRLRKALDERKLFDNEKFNIWLNLSYRPMPPRVSLLRNQQKAKVMLRCDGAWNMDIVPLLIGRKSKYLSKLINPYFNTFLNRNYYFNLKKTDLIIYQSKFCRFSVEHFVYKPSIHSVVINNGIDLNEFSPIARENKGKKDLNILISHRIQPVKRVQQAPYLIQELRKKYPSVRVHVVGGGVYNTLGRIKGIVKSLHLEKHFIFYDHQSPDVLPNVYTRCDFMLCLSYLDPCPNTIIEALACGLPVLYPCSGGVPEIVDDAGYGVDEEIDENDYNVYWHFRTMPQIPIAKYIEGVDTIVGNLDVLSKKARERAERYFNIDDVVEKYIQAGLKLWDEK